MDTLSNYRDLVKRVLSEYYELRIQNSDAKTETTLVFDPIHDNYLLLTMGWDGSDRIKNIIIHIRLQEEKIWIEEDWTEDGVVTDFLQAGIPRDHIVLAFHPPHLRQYTEFAST